MLKRYITLLEHTVIAGNRNPAHSTSQTSAELPKGDGSKLIVVKLDALIDQNAFSAIQGLPDKHGIDHLDIVIANAGVPYAWPLVAKLKFDDFRGHMSPIVQGFIALYQATQALMQKSSREPLFAPIGFSAGSIVNQHSIPNAAYGPTKAAVN
ncbi:hypothetical protein BDV95DRAFT_600437 [Massariosphaeria phaeospora]|uniref:Norsolorinic acid reductase n=1 Tax=Massariosphaeria phaeospora TaxID=100035 RepID=A0A7C8MGJ2_9PLEO|nr:hypothetical protein BDV95DRAFT_600437 [Massariosphaeria phaeospora]